MRTLFAIILIIGISAGCEQMGTDDENTTSERVYSADWDGDPIEVSARDADGSEETIHEVSETGEVERLIEALRQADWEENVMVDIRPPDYQFQWNDYLHFVWQNDEVGRLELVIDGEENYGRLSRNASEEVLSILTGENIEFE